MNIENITITEDYVSFETAKLLKEKGFNEKCISVYHDGELQLVSSLGIFCGEGYGEQILTYTNSECEWSPIMISAPTIQMAMKWLREKKGIAVIPVLSSVLDNERFLWDVKIVVAKTNDSYSQGWVYETQESACDVAISYCLKELI